MIDSYSDDLIRCLVLEVCCWIEFVMAASNKKRSCEYVVPLHFATNQMRVTYFATSNPTNEQITCNLNHSMTDEIYRRTSNIRRNLVGNKIVDQSDVVGASPVGAAPTTSSFST